MHHDRPIRGRPANGGSTRADSPLTWEPPGSRTRSEDHSAALADAASAAHSGCWGSVMCSNSLIVYSFLPFSMVGWFSMLVLDAFDSVHQDDRRVASRP